MTQKNIVKNNVLSGDHLNMHHRMEHHVMKISANDQERKIEYGKKIKHGQ